MWSKAGIGSEGRLDAGRQAIGAKRVGQGAVGGQHALRTGFGVRNERAGGAEMRTRDTADGIQFRQRRARGLAVGRTVRTGRRIAGLGDEHTDPHRRIPQLERAS
ncbi:hypothetical protein [Burkholderia metallica]|uniref:hypothetical protein n=1 Tax=Burkholderia metallica TaxID=488729 RepID=UPI001FC7DF1D|nr:hypothetical protein [Burkholderia metallica]